MDFSVLLAAEDLMLDPMDIREIFDAFFEDAEPLLNDGTAALRAGDRRLLSRKMHAFKGAALNLRMEALGNMAAQAEKNETLSEGEAEKLLQAIRVELVTVHSRVAEFYRGQTTR